MTQTETPTAEAGTTTGTWLRQGATVYTLKCVDRPHGRGPTMVNDNWFFVQGPDAEEVAERVHAALAASTAPRAPAAVPDERARCAYIAEMHDSEGYDPEARHCARSIAACIRDDGFQLRDEANNPIAAAPTAPPADGGTDGLREALELIISTAENPTVNPLETGFRHSPLTQKEIVERLSLACEEVVRYARAALARHQAPAVDVPAERDRIARIIRREVTAQRNYIHGERCADLIVGIEAATDAILATRPTDPGGARRWEDISTAPKDPEYDVDHDLPGDADEGVGIATRVDTGSPAYLVWWSQTGPGRSKTTHWRPLPKPPAASTASSDAGGQS